MRVFLSGGAGCIGSELAEALLREGHEVVIFDNLSSGKFERIAPLLDQFEAKFVHGDLLDPALVETSLRGCDRVFHLAANPDIKFEPGDPTDKDLRQNTLATYNLLEAMRKLGVCELVFSSSSAVYGASEKQPIGEFDFFPQPISLYGATKLACEALISSFSHLFGIRAWIFRFANIVGGKSRKHGTTVISDFVARLRQDREKLVILGNGKQSKAYLSIRECIEGMLFAVQHARNRINILNLGPEDTVTVTRIAEMVVAALGLNGVQFAYTGTEGGWPGDVPRFQLDVSAMKRLGWKARLSSEEAVGEAIRATIAGDS